MKGECTKGSKCGYKHVSTLLLEWHTAELHAAKRCQVQCRLFAAVSFTFSLVFSAIVADQLDFWQLGGHQWVSHPMNEMPPGASTVVLFSHAASITLFSYGLPVCVLQPKGHEGKDAVLAPADGPLKASISGDEEFTISLEEPRAMESSGDAAEPAAEDTPAQPAGVVSHRITDLGKGGKRLGVNVLLKGMFPMRGQTLSVHLPARWAMLSRRPKGDQGSQGVIRAVKGLPSPLHAVWSQDDLQPPASTTEHAGPTCH